MVIKPLQRCATVEAPVIYCYFVDAGQKDLTPSAILTDLLRQILRANLSTSQTVLEYMYQAAENGDRQPTMNEIQYGFREACKVYRSVTIVMDALDEAEFATIDSITSIVNLSNNRNIALFATSRPRPELRDYLYSRLTATFALDIETKEANLSQYLLARLSWAENLKAVLSTGGPTCDVSAQHLLLNPPGFDSKTCVQDHFVRTIIRKTKFRYTRSYTRS